MYSAYKIMVPPCLLSSNTLSFHSQTKMFKSLVDNIISFSIAFLGTFLELYGSGFHRVQRAQKYLSNAPTHLIIHELSTPLETRTWRSISAVDTIIYFFQMDSPFVGNAFWWHICHDGIGPDFFEICGETLALQYKTTGIYCATSEGRYFLTLQFPLHLCKVFRYFSLESER